MVKSAGTTKGLCLKECAQIGVMINAFVKGYITGPPAARLYAVEPVGVDGQDDYEMYCGDVLVIEGAKIGARLLHRKEHNYFSVLREKLSWGDKS